MGLSKLQRHRMLEKESKLTHRWLIMNESALIRGIHFSHEQNNSYAHLFPFMLVHAESIDDRCWFSLLFGSILLCSLTKLLRTVVGALSITLWVRNTTRVVVNTLWLLPRLIIYILHKRDHSESTNPLNSTYTFLIILSRITSWTHPMLQCFALKPISGELERVV